MRRNPSVVPSSPSLRPPEAPTRLKAERVQQFLREHPEWSLAKDRCGLTRSVRLASSAAAWAFAAWVAETAQAFRKSPRVSTEGHSVEITIARRGREFTAHELDLARALSLLPPVRRKAA